MEEQIKNEMLLHHQKEVQWQCKLKRMDLPTGDDLVRRICTGSLGSADKLAIDLHRVIVCAVQMAD